MKKLFLLALALCMLLCACQAVPNVVQSTADGAEEMSAATLGSAQSLGTQSAEEQSAQNAENSDELDDEDKIKLTIEKLFRVSP